MPFHLYKMHLNVLYYIRDKKDIGISTIIIITYPFFFLDWNATSYDGEIPIPPEKMVFILPMVLQHLCPLAVSVIGISAVSAAGMSSTDSIILSTGSVFSKNIYKNIFRPQVSNTVICVLIFKEGVCNSRVRKKKHRLKIDKTRWGTQTKKSTNQIKEGKVRSDEHLLRLKCHT